MFGAKDYVRARSLDEAYELNQKKSNLLIGGMMWAKMAGYKKLTVIDLSGLGLDAVEEDEEEFRIGCMCTLRSLETHPGLNRYFQGVFRECVRSVVGVQFRNTATVGGSVFGRFGFSDLLTCLMSMDTRVALHHGGVVTLKEFCSMPRDRDVLVRVIVKKDGRACAYGSQRLTKTDFPIIACGTSFRDGIWTLSVGARPAKAALWEHRQQDGESPEQIARQAAEQFSYGDNMRAGGEYRKQLAAVYLRRNMERILEGGV